MKKLGENMSYLFWNAISVNTLGIIFWLLLSIFLTADDFGKISYINSLSLFFVNLFTIGVFSAVWKYCSENKFKKIFLISFIFTSIFPTFLILMFLFSINLHLNIHLTFLTFLLSITLIFSIYFENILYGYQEFKKIFYSNLVASIFRIIFILSFYFINQISVTTALVSTILELMIAAIFKLIFSFKYIVFRVKFEINFREFKRFFSFAISSFLSTFSSNFFPNFLVIFSFLYISSTIAGVVYFSQLIYSVISFFPLIIINASLPIISNLVVRNKVEQSFSLVKPLFKISLIIILPLIFLVSIYIINILNIIGVQTELIQYSPNIFLIISVSSTFLLLSNIFFSFLFSLSKIRYTYYIEIFSVLLLFILSFFSMNSNYFLIFYFLTAFIRYFLYSVAVLRIIGKFFSFNESFKIVLYCFFVFIIPVFLSYKVYFFGIINMFISAVLIIFVIKILRLIEVEDRKFLSSLKMNYNIEKLIMSIV